jgi:NAD(P)H-dependent FMN reductase
MKKISILSASIRNGRQSSNVALYFQKFIAESKLAEVVLLDLKELNFPLFEERLMNTAEPLPSLVNYANSIASSDAVIIVSPEYNGSLPASLKNAIDVLNSEWQRKVVGLVGVSSGSFGGVNMIPTLQTILIRLKAVPSSITFPVPMVQNNFDETGNSIDKESTDKRATIFINELLWLTNKLATIKEATH